MPRLLIACPVPHGPALEACQTELAKLGPKVRLVNAKQCHVALRLIGDVDASVVPAIQQAMQQAAKEITPFNAGLARMDALPTPKRPKVAVAMCGPMRTWRSIAEKLDKHLDVLEGVPARDKPLLPHVVLAKLQIGRGPQTRRHNVLGPRITEVPVAQLNWRVKAMVLVESIDTEKGTVYKPLSTCTMKKTDSTA